MNPMALRAQRRPASARALYTARAHPADTKPSVFTGMPDHQAVAGETVTTTAAR